MKKSIHLLSLLLVLSSFSCTKKIADTTVLQTNTDKGLETLIDLMTGTFSSSEQASSDTTFYNINLVMYPIWEKDKSAKWLYVEQAVTQMLRRPYRQRVYKVTHNTDGRYESKVYELPEPKAYVNAWKTPALFKALSPEDLVEREGCSVFLNDNGEGCFTGSTKEQDCKSTMRGASYATSVVTVCKDQVVSWDQGWDLDHQQVWGAEVEGYVFKRIN